MIPTIYLSSTYEDLKDHRRVVFDALRKSGYQVIAMEDYVATDRRPVEACLRDIDENAQIYVGIFAFRYGYVPPAEHVRDCRYTSEHDDWQGLSITELEFRYADKKDILPCLTFVAKEGSNWDLKFVDAYTERNQEFPGHCIDRLRKYLFKEKMASEFSSPHELASLVQASVARHLQEKGNLSFDRTLTQPTNTWNIEKDGSPYPGLMNFKRKYAPVFFGREAEVREVLDRLLTNSPRFLLISGDSGVGKSSFVEAGLLPVLEESGLPGGQACEWVRMVPSGGPHPFDALMRALHTQAERAGLAPYEMGEALCKNLSDLSACIGEIAQKGMDRSTLVLFLDQMEELFTSQAQEYADAFLAALCEAARKGLLWVIATIRSDHLQHCERHPDLLEVLRGQGYYPLGPVDTIAMADMIRKPARCATLEITDRLVRRIAKESGSEAGSLPMLAFVLQRLFELRDGRTISEKVYENLGGVSGALAGHIKTVEEKLRQHNTIGTALEDHLQKLFQDLLVVNSEGLPTRRRALLNGLTKDLRPLVDGLIKARLLTTEGEGADSTVSVSHEQLFDAWLSLARWIAENKDDLRILRQAEIESREWERHDHDMNYLWRVERLKKLQEILRRQDSPTLSDRVGRYAEPQEVLVKLLNISTLSHQERMEIGSYLAELGDPRPGVSLRKDGVPDIVWCKVPGGEITLEDKAGPFRVKPFHISKYPVTYVQYRAFLEAEDGYRDEGWWEGLAERQDAPGEQYRKQDNHPVENVSWYDAVAYCRWLSKQLGYDIRLPTEWEWQQAATGGDKANEYPWGRDWDSDRANTAGSGLSHTTTVGLYPQGASPVGALDMVGNVWEWCLNEYENPLNYAVEGDEYRVLRGGSWDAYFHEASTAYRYSYYKPNFRLPFVGFRVRWVSPIL